MNKHQCLYCSSPCALTLAMSSEGCTNPQCQAYAPPKEEKPAELKEAAPISDSGVKTGRLSSKEPHTSNPPKPDRKVEGLKFLSPTGRAFQPLTLQPIRDYMAERRLPGLKTDYADLEWRAVAHALGMAEVTADPPFGDLYIGIASKILGIPPEQVTMKQRAQAKNSMFQGLYGGGGDDAVDAAAYAMMASYAQKDAEATHSFFEKVEREEAHVRELEKLVPFQLHEQLVSRRCSCTAKVIRVDFLKGFKSKPALVVRESSDCALCKGAMLEGSKANLLKYWRRNTKFMEDFSNSVEMYKVHRLRWAQTLRVTDRKPGVSKESIGVQLLGVMSLVDVPQRFKGLTAIYEYVSIEDPVAGRFRLTISKGSGPKDPYSVLECSAWGLTVNFTRLDPESMMNIKNIHCPQILKEMRADLDKVRTVRTPSEAEMAMFARMRGPIDKKEGT